MEDTNRQPLQKSYFQPWIPAQKPPPLSKVLQEERIPHSGPLQAGVWMCRMGLTPQERQRQARENTEITEVRRPVYNKGLRSRHEDCVTEMLQPLCLQSLEERRRQLRLTFLYKVVEGRVPAINIEHYLKSQQQKRTVRAKQYTDFVTKT